MEMMRYLVFSCLVFSSLAVAELVIVAEVVTLWLLSPIRRIHFIIRDYWWFQLPIQDYLFSPSLPLYFT